jgi:hypothetical protein
LFLYENGGKKIFLFSLCIVIKISFAELLGWFYPNSFLTTAGKVLGGTLRSDSDAKMVKLIMASLPSFLIKFQSGY